MVTLWTSSDTRYQPTALKPTVSERILVNTYCSSPIKETKNCTVKARLARLAPECLGMGGCRASEVGELLQTARVRRDPG